MAEGMVCCICGKSPAVEYNHEGKYYCDKHRYHLRIYGNALRRNKRTKNEIIKFEDHAEILLYNRENEEIKRAIIDLDDFDLVSVYKWRYNHGYANHRMSGMSLQNLIMDFTPDKKHIIDHINRDRLDCRKNNLRVVDYFVNGYNKGTQSNNTSGFPGVFYIKSIDRWKANIKVHKKNIGLGTFKNKEEAILARKVGETTYFGEEINRDNDKNTIFKSEE